MLDPITTRSDREILCQHLRSFGINVSGMNGLRIGSRFDNPYAIHSSRDITNHDRQYVIPSYFLSDFISSSNVAAENQLNYSERVFNISMDAFRRSFSLERPVLVSDQMPESINATQKNIIEGFLSFAFESFQNITPASIAMRALELISIEKLNKEDHIFLEKNDLSSEVESIRAVLQHPYPQNRAVGDPTTGVGPEGVKDGRVYFWRNGFGTGALSEPQGLMGLTARNDSSAFPISRKATVDYIKTLLKKESLRIIEKNKIEKRELRISYEAARAERLGFLNLKSQILGTSNNKEAELVRDVFRKCRGKP